MVSVGHIPPFLETPPCGDKVSARVPPRVSHELSFARGGVLLGPTPSAELTSPALSFVAGLHLPPKTAPPLAVKSLRSRLT